ncbi:hypothetical protein JMJ77_0005217 [Colletotrichum scovillei]|uniref:Uncharacterized protein n=1 Tax=Colletotrichum scovillei TaxID=1209932 RepID=A0A9P7UHY5_9PEZI|nr:hypothetical protein JMJ77_0005217 [Colletotrichum scovillei]KAG7076432.1 hypothetical protein JMJ76_0013697 [Colletotrichum scovillei]KAG7083516.1 hypothetical protein JMJ78_0008961 [Colletotrichum scovillei]
MHKLHSVWVNLTPQHNISVLGLGRFDQSSSKVYRTIINHTLYL